jgi:carbonic anhydrase
MSSKRLSRREFVRVSGVTAGLVTGAMASTIEAAEPAIKRDADSVLAKLLAGNKRFVKGETIAPRRTPADFARLADGQAPLAVLVGCADSRVSPELIFDQGVGDLFVVRVAGNIISGAGASVKGSIEYAVAELGIQLVIVLGHSQCGAVKAAIKHIDDKDALPGSIGALVNTIKPCVTSTKGLAGNQLDNVIKANVKRGVERLEGLEPILAAQIKKGKLKVVGAVYELGTGKVVVLS